MKRFFRVCSGLALLVGLASAAGLGGCQAPQAGWSGWQWQLMSREQPIQRVWANPDQSGEVRLQGTVGDRVPLVNGQVYQLTDGTGRVWVVTTDTTVMAGEELLILAQVRFQEMPELGSNQGEIYVEELRQLERR